MLLQPVCFGGGSERQQEGGRHTGAAAGARKKKVREGQNSIQQHFIASSACVEMHGLRILMRQGIPARSLPYMQG